MFKTLKDAAQLAKDLADALAGNAKVASNRAEQSLGIETVRVQFRCGTICNSYAVIMKRLRGEKFKVVGYDVGATSEPLKANSGTSVAAETKLADEFDFSDWSCPCCRWEGGANSMTFMSCMCGNHQCGSTARRVAAGTQMTCEACGWKGLTAPPDGTMRVVKTRAATALPPAPRQVLLPKK